MRDQAQLGCRCLSKYLMPQGTIGNQGLMQFEAPTGYSTVRFLVLCGQTRLPGGFRLSLSPATSSPAHLAQWSFGPGRSRSEVLCRQVNRRARRVEYDARKA